MTTCAFPSYVNFFLKMMYSHRKQVFLTFSRNQNFLHCPTMIDSLLHLFLKIIWILHFCSNVSVSFMKKSKNSLNFSLYHYQGYSKSQRGVKKVHANWLTCLDWLSLKLQIFFNFGDSGQFVTKIGCPFFWCFLWILK